MVMDPRAQNDALVNILRRLPIETPEGPVEQPMVSVIERMRERGKLAAVSAMGLPMPKAVGMTGGAGGYGVAERTQYTQRDMTSQVPKFMPQGSSEQQYWLPGTA